MNLMVLTGVWEAWSKFIRFSTEKQLSRISSWPSSWNWEAIVGMCSMCVVYTSSIHFSSMRYLGIFLFSCSHRVLPIAFYFSILFVKVTIFTLPLLCWRHFFVDCECLLCPLFTVMHDMRLIHTDLKPENILFVSADYIKVPDYKV